MKPAKSVLQSRRATTLGAGPGDIRQIVQMIPEYQVQRPGKSIPARRFDLAHHLAVRSQMG